VQGSAKMTGCGEIRQNSWNIAPLLLNRYVILEKGPGDEVKSPRP
jgi:hypothetical protein